MKPPKVLKEYICSVSYRGRFQMREHYDKKQVDALLAAKDVEMDNLRSELAHAESLLLGTHDAEHPSYAELVAEVAALKDADMDFSAYHAYEAADWEAYKIKMTANAEALQAALADAREIVASLARRCTTYLHNDFDARERFLDGIQHDMERAGLIGDGGDDETG